MKKTKYLFNSEKQTPEGMISVSQIQSFLSCPKKWSYGYLNNLAPRVERSYLTIGKLCHKGMETAMWHRWKFPDTMDLDELTFQGVSAMEDMWNEYMNVTPFLDEEMPEQEQLFNDAKSIFTQALSEFNPLKYDVLEVYDGKEERPALELHFAIPCAGSKGLHGYIDSILVDRETGHTWCTDYKFRKSLSPDDEEQFNLQNSVYTWACHRMGIDITGTMTWQHCNTPAATPKVNKDGSVSRAKVKTTWKMYAKFVKDLGLNPAEYSEMEEKLADVEFFRATQEYRNMETVKRIWSTIVVPASYAIKRAGGPNGKNTPAMYPWNCKMCSFCSLCQAELRGYDVDYIKTTEYTVKGHRQ